MDRNEIKKLFENELALINVNDLVKLVLDVLEKESIKDFWTCPTSSTGKYHPSQCNKKYGLILHTKLVIAYANILIDALYDNNEYYNRNRNIIISSAILHDIAKKESYNNYSEYNNHSITAANIFDEVYKSANYDIRERTIKEIHDCILYHGGIYSPKQIQKPIDEFKLNEIILYIADYLASRKYQGKNKWIDNQYKLIFKYMNT